MSVAEGSARAGDNVVLRTSVGVVGGSVVCVVGAETEKVGVGLRIEGKATVGAPVTEQTAVITSVVASFSGASGGAGKKLG